MKQEQLKIVEEALAELFASKTQVTDSLEGRVLAAFWEEVRNTVYEAMRQYAGGLGRQSPEPLSKEEKEWMDSPMGPTSRKRKPCTRRSSSRQPWMGAVAALLADGVHTDDAAEQCGVPKMAVRRFKGTHAEYIEELRSTEPGDKRYRYIQKHFGMGMPREVA